MSDIPTLYVGAVDDVKEKFITARTTEAEILAQPCVVEALKKSIAAERGRCADLLNKKISAITDKIDSITDEDGDCLVPGQLHLLEAKRDEWVDVLVAVCVEE